MKQIELFNLAAGDKFAFSHNKPAWLVITVLTDAAGNTAGIEAIQLVNGVKWKNSEKTFKKNVPILLLT